MKKISLLLLMGLLFLAGCNLGDMGNIKIIDDEIDNSKAVILQVIYKSSDTGMSNYRALITYSKKIKENEPAITLVNFKINTSLKESMLSPSCYLVTGAQKHPLTLSNISAKNDSVTTTETNLDNQVEVRTYRFYIMEGEFRLPTEMTDQIKNSAKLVCRLYLGSRPLTFEVTQKELDLVKTFIETE